MNSSFHVKQALQQFSGRAPIFPLPNVVLFPHILLPLHVFEDGYREMVSDASHGEGLIAVALPRPSWEYQTKLDDSCVFETVCLGRITGENCSADGQYSLALEGLSRARIIDEEDGSCPYRVARLELLGDHYPADSIIDRRQRQRELLAGLREMFARMDLDQVLLQAYDADVPLGGLCDVIAYSMQLEPTAALGILEEANVDLRSELVLECLRDLSSSVSSQPVAISAANDSAFPPRFSRN